LDVSDVLVVVTGNLAEVGGQWQCCCVEDVVVPRVLVDDLYGVVDEVLEFVFDFYDGEFFFAFDIDFVEVEVAGLPFDRLVPVG
jgi:hypothetical protein